MKQQLIERYKETLLNIYAKEQLNDCPYNYVLVFKEHDEEVIDNILLISYKDFFNKSYLKLPVSAIRKPNKLLTYQDGLNILNKVAFGTLSITNDIPYCFGITHFIVDGKLYFHTGYKGMKITGIDKTACYHVIEDLGINPSLATQNYQSVTIYGTLKEVTENKKALIDALLVTYCPHHQKNLTKQSIENTLVLELTIDHMDVKRHYH
ncbi:MAG: pyridoxamine 5'-phosphate oxidase family protein [Coprobacillus sp.]